MAFQLFEGSKIGKALVGQDLIIYAANSAYAELLGYTVDELIGMGIDQLSHEEDFVREHEQRQRFWRGEDPRLSLRKRYRRKDGTIIWVDLDAIEGLSIGEHRYAIAEVQNVTSEVEAAEQLERKRAMLRVAEARLIESEEQARHAHKMEAIGQLAGGIAHDFNNLLTVIGTYGEFLRDELAPGTTGRADLEELLAAARRAGLLTRQLLAFSRRQRLSPVIVDANGVVDGVSELLRRLLGEQVNLVIALHHRACHVHADPGQLEQILLNLAVNGRDAMENGGTLRIETDVVRFGQEELGTFSLASAVEDEAPAGTDYVVLRIRDEGVGMSEDVRQKMFEPFFTTKPLSRGTGLGLSTVYGIVAQSKGHIRVETLPGMGTTIEVFLPLHRADAVFDALVDDVLHDGPAAGEETILVVEDELPVRRSLERLLRRSGYTVLEAADGEEGLSIWRQHRSSIDLVLTDLVMPEMGGAELSRHIAAEDPAARIMFLSGYASEEVHASLHPNAMVLSKPFDSPALLRAIRNALDAQSRQQVA